MLEPLLPLAGVRVVDFGHVWAGPYCAATLADLGAEVIKIESERRLDVHRRQGPYPEGRPGINRSGVWNAQNRNKQSLMLDLATDEGREEVRRLVAHSDIVIENFSPGVMAKLGLSYDSLAAVKPDIIMISLSAYGQEGPQKHYVGYGPSLDATSGLCSLTAYQDRCPNALGGIFSDTGSALYGVFAVLKALRERDRSGHGAYIDFSELELCALLAADMLVRFPGEDVPVEWLGNNDPYNVPQGAYPCAGDDRWIMISIDTDAAWLGLCETIGKPEWAGAAEYGTPQSRAARRDEIDAAIGVWTKRHVPDDAFRSLQARGVPAGLAYDMPGLLDDEQVKARKFFVSVDHPEVGAQIVYAPIWRFDDTVGEVRPAPLLGQNNLDAVPYSGGSASSGVRS